MTNKNHLKIDITYDMYVGPLYTHNSEQNLRIILNAMDQSMYNLIKERESLLRQGCEKIDLIDINSQIEDCIGIAFVACQIDIKRATSQIFKFKELMESRGHRINKKWNNKCAIQDWGANKHRCNGSIINVIDVLANYWKHRDEWDEDSSGWKTNKNNKHTIAQIGNLGITSGTYYNFSDLQDCLREFGLADVVGLVDQIYLWRKSLWLNVVELYGKAGFELPKQIKIIM